MRNGLALGRTAAPDAETTACISSEEEVVEGEIPSGFSTALGGISREFVESSRVVYLTFGIALIVIFLVLAAQVESFVHPLTVMLSVPLSSLGALGALFLLTLVALGVRRHAPGGHL